MASPNTLRQTFFEQVVNLDALLGLFDTLPEIYFFVKDAEGRFMMVNQPLLGVLGLKNESQIIGKNDDDFFTPDLAERYRREDREVMAGGKLVPHRVWIVPNPQGIIRWFVSSKTPLFDRAGNTIGIAGAMRDYERAGAALSPYRRFSESMRHVSQNYRKKISTDKLAAMAHLSVSQFNRQFRKLFGITPAQYVIQVRVNAASQALTHSDDDLASIATSCGFYDASHFVKQFQKMMDMTPAQYRRRYATPADTRPRGVTD
jgi:PAS domain S-box-containing protein